MVNKGLIPILFNNPIPQEYKDYSAYVTQQGGTIQNTKNALDWIKLLKSMGVYNNTRVLWSGGMGVTIDPNAPGDTISRAYSADPLRNNLVQDTKANQPLRVGQIQGIAEGLYNGNGGVRFMSHTDVSFNATDAWSIVFSLNWNGNSTTSYITSPSLSSIANIGLLGLKFTSNNNVFFRELDDPYNIKFFNLSNTMQYVGKNNIISIVADGLGNLNLYINGVLIQVITAITKISFKYLNNSRPGEQFYGSYNNYRLQSGTMTTAQIAAEAAFLQAHYPEIPTTLIGSKYFAITPFRAVCSSNGTVITEVQATASWVAGTSAWCYNNGNTTPDAANTTVDSVYGKLYNKAAKLVITANPPSGYHVATEAELTALVALGGNALKATGTGQWTSANGTNTTGLFLLGGGNRKADGSFNAVKSIATVWCADSDKVLQVTDAGIASIETADAKEGHTILLVKD